MKKINIIYKGDTFEVNISNEKAYPNSLFKVEFGDNSKLSEILQSPIYIEEKKNLLSYIHIDSKTQDQIDLLGSIASGIENQYYQNV